MIEKEYQMIDYIYRRNRLYLSKISINTFGKNGKFNEGFDIEKIKEDVNEFIRTKG